MAALAGDPIWTKRSRILNSTVSGQKN